MFLSTRVLYFFIALNTGLIVTNLFILDNPSAAFFNFLCAGFLWVGIIGREENGDK